MPRTKEQNMVIRERTREKIIRAAMELFAEHGYEATSVNAIAKRANISKGLIYNHFETKDDLISGILAEIAKIQEKVTSHYSDDLPADQKLKVIIQEGFQSMRDQRELMKWLMPLGFEIKKHPFVQQIFKDGQVMMEATFIPIFKELGYEDAEGETKMLSALFSGVKFGLGFDGFFDLDEMENLILKKYKLNTQ